MSTTPRRLFAPALPAEGGRVTLSEEASHHGHVLRLSVGDAVCLFDGQGREAPGRIVQVSEGAIDCEVGPSVQAVEPGPRLTLVQALPKGSKVDNIVRMATELGVYAIRLAVSERAVVRPDARKGEQKRERLERVAQEAARQSGRASVPHLAAPAPLMEVARLAPPTANRLVFALDGQTPLDDALDANATDTWICIGPEGGFSAQEVEDLKGEGFHAVGLGTQVLRVETAAPVAVALAMSALGGMRPSGRTSVDA